MHTANRARTMKTNTDPSVDLNDWDQLAQSMYTDILNITILSNVVNISRNDQGTFEDQRIGRSTALDIIPYGQKILKNGNLVRSITIASEYFL